MPAHPPAEAEGKAQGVLPAGGPGGNAPSAWAHTPCPDATHDPTKKACICLGNSEAETPSLALHGEAKKEQRRVFWVGIFFYLLMKVVVESNQVEIAFKALQSPLEEILFGAAPLKAKAGGIHDAQHQLVLQP